MDNCDILASGSSCPILGCMYLERAAQAEDTVVGLLGLEALKSGVDNVVLLGEQVVGPVRQSVSSGSRASKALDFPIQCIQCMPCVYQPSTSSPCPAFSQGAAYLRPSCL